jgi:hypothetical protein
MNIHWSELRRFVCIGGRVGYNVVSGVRLRDLYTLTPHDCLTAESPEDPRLHGYPIEHCTILRPLENNNYINKHTASGYGFPHVNIPLTDVTIPFLLTLRSNWYDTTALAIFADTLDDIGFSDQRFHWLLRALRDPEQSIYIDRRIWEGALIQIRLQGLLRATEVAWDQLENINKDSVIVTDVGGVLYTDVKSNKRGKT